MVEISISLLTMHTDNVVHALYELEVAKINYFHIDVMDGKFVEKNTIDIMKNYALTISHISNIPLDIHFMVEDIEQHIEEYLSLKPDRITFHIEAVKDIERVKTIIKMLKENHIKVGIAISPDTSIDVIKPFLPYVHMILVMTVVPGKGGQKLIPSTIEKVRALKEYVTQNHIDIDIQVDGGINDKTAKLVKEAGANILVAGNYVTSSDNFKESVANLKLD